MALLVVWTSRLLSFSATNLRPLAFTSSRSLLSLTLLAGTVPVANSLAYTIEVTDELDPEFRLQIVRLFSEVAELHKSLSSKFSNVPKLARLEKVLSISIDRRSDVQAFFSRLTALEWARQLWSLPSVQVRVCVCVFLEGVPVLRIESRLQDTLFFFCPQIHLLIPFVGFQDPR